MLISLFGLAAAPGRGASRSRPVAPVLASAALAQAGPDLIASVRLGSRPRRPTVCIQLMGRGNLCVRLRPGSLRGLFGKPSATAHAGQVAVQAHAGGGGRWTLRWTFAQTRVGYGQLAWRVEAIATNGGCRHAGAAPGCRAVFPRASAPPGHVRVRRFRLTGCRARLPEYREHGSRHLHAIALTMDGGPTGYTSPVLRILRRYGVPVTFFIRGQFAAAKSGLLRRELREGNELANHSFTHPHYPSQSELARTSALIRRATGFTPCLFRAPYGDINAQLLGAARRLRMVTIQWDVDSLDSLGASTGQVFGRVRRLARNGSIILMHDGEGRHDATVRALARILRTLQRRHYRFVTVSELLGFRDTWHYQP